MQKYNVVRSLDDLKVLNDYLMDGDKPRFERLSVDTETNGLAHWKDVVIGISISADSKTGWYIPLLSWVPNTEITKTKKDYGEIYPEGEFQCQWDGNLYPENVTQGEYKVPKWLKTHLEKWFKGVDLIMHNAPFDCLMIEKNLGLDLSLQVLCDTVLLKHVLDENTSCALKEVAKLWQTELGIPAEEQANKEALEMGASVIKNGGTYNTRTKTVWRADLEVMAKYAIADTFLTYGVFEVGMGKFLSEYDEKHWEWFFQDEVMPLCREVVIPMKRRGVRINVEHFREMQAETQAKLTELEDNIVGYLIEKGYLQGFTKGKTLEQAVTKKRLVEEIMKLEGLAYPTKMVKGVSKQSLDKKTVEKAYQKEPHWLWGYLLGEDEIRYSPEKLNEIKKKLYIQQEGRKHQFNIGSDFHLRWLFCEKLGHDPKSLPQTDSATKDKIIPSMKAEVLEDFFLAKYPFVKTLLLYNKLDKLYSTYIVPALNLNYNGYLYMDMMQHGTISGRFACGGGFNLQTLPKVEEIDKCKKCGSKNLTTVNPIKLLAVSYCNDCDHMEEDLLCSSAIKAGFIAPEGMKIVNADYSSLEPRCFAFMSGDEKLKKVYKDGLDLYSKVYCDMEDKEGRYSADPKAPNFLKKMDNSKRNMVKPVVLGIPYGARGPQTANLMGWFKEIDVKGEIKQIPDVEKGNAFREKYLDTYPALRDYMLKSEAQANGDGFVETLVGRRRHFKFAPKVFKLLAASEVDYEAFIDERRKNLSKMDLKVGVLNKASLEMLSKDLDFALFDPKKRIFRDWAFVRGMYKNELNNAKNFKIQALGAHLTNRAMLDMTRAFREEGLNAWVCLQVHDEITVYGDDAQLDAVARIVQRCMEKNKYTALVDIPMEAAPVIANNLKESK